MIRPAVIILGLTASPAVAEWHYCYSGPPPEGVALYMDFPPRPVGFEYAVLPFSFKRLCGLDAEQEAAHIRRLVREDLQCTAGSDLSNEIDLMLKANLQELSDNYFGQPVDRAGHAWAQVCKAAEVATVATLRFVSTWAFDEAVEPLQKRADMIALGEALNTFSQSQGATQ